MPCKLPGDTGLLVWDHTLSWETKKALFSFLQQCLVLPSGLTQSPFAERCLLPDVGPFPSATPPPYASHVLSPSPIKI